MTVVMSKTQKYPFEVKYWRITLRIHFSFVAPIAFCTTITTGVSMKNIIIIINSHYYQRNQVNCQSAWINTDFECLHFWKYRKVTEAMGAWLRAPLTPLKTLEMALETRASRLSARRSNITPRSCCCTFSSPSAAKKALVIWRGQRSDGERSRTGRGRGTGRTCDLSSEECLGIYWAWGRWTRPILMNSLYTCKYENKIK